MGTREGWRKPQNVVETHHMRTGRSASVLLLLSVFLTRLLLFLSLSYSFILSFTHALILSFCHLLILVPPHPLLNPSPSTLPFTTIVFSHCHLRTLSVPRPSFPLFPFSILSLSQSPRPLLERIPFTHPSARHSLGAVRPSAPKQSPPT